MYIMLSRADRDAFGLLLASHDGGRVDSRKNGSCSPTEGSGQLAKDTNVPSSLYRSLVNF
jgi:hypothetical protein